MRNPSLHRALLAFAEEAAWQLSSDTAEGHEVPFEVVEARGSRRDHPLYCYRPLTADFIHLRQSVIARLPTFLPAVHALAATGGLGAYLRDRVARGGVDGLQPLEQAELALRALLSRMFQETTEFVLSTERFERAYHELEAVVFEGRTETEVLVPVLGLVLRSREVPMGDGLTLVRSDCHDDAPLEASTSEDGDPTVLAICRWEAEPGDLAPLEVAQVRLGRLLTALRLFDANGVALGAAAWTRTAGSPWRAVVLGGPATGGWPRGRCLVEPAQEDELRAFCSLVGRRTPRAGVVAWALRRFELGCTREEPGESLTDHLLALRALLEPEGTTSGLLAPRLAAVCAEPAHRARLQARLEHAVLLEHALIAGVGVPSDEAVDALAAQVEDLARAILRDVLCGHLDPDVRAVADSLMAPPAHRAPVEQPTLA